MIGLLARKAFYDFWDNLLSIGLINLGFIASALIPAFAPSILSAVPALGIAVALAGLAWCSVYGIAAARMMARISDRQSFGFRDFGAALGASIRPGLALGALVAIALYLVTTALPFYLGMGSILGLVAGATLFWVLVLATLAFQFFPAAASRVDGGVKRAARRSLELFFDNTPFAIFLFLIALPLIAISFFLAFLLPGPAGILLFVDEAYRLRMRKYGWLHDHPEASKKKIPWREILEEEDELTGRRTLKQLAFPWKD